MDTLTKMAAAVAARDVSPVELVESSLAVIERIEPRLNAFTHVLADEALQEARRLQNSPATGALHGVPVAVKELYDVAGAGSTGCSAAYEDRIADEDSEVVQRLRSAGAIVVAKTNQHELACGTTTQLSSFGGARNPWNTAHVPGGSSGGSGIAVATRAVTMAMGSDTAGSIRIPASCCGVTGLKPTNGAVSLRGAMPLSRTFDCAGPLAVSAEDCRLVHSVLAGHDPLDPYSREPGHPVAVRPVETLRIGVPQTFLDGADAAVISILHEARAVLSGLGVAVEDVEGPALADADVSFGRILAPEFAADHRSIVEDSRASEFMRARLRAGQSALVTDYLDALALRHRFSVHMRECLQGYDAYLAPVQLFPPLPIAEVTDNPAAPGANRPSSTRLCAPANVAGLPALALPAGFTPGGLPVAVQLIGHAWSEDLLCAIGAAFQAETDWHLRTPPE